MNADIKHLPSLLRQAKKAVKRLNALAPFSLAEEPATDQVAAGLESLEEELAEMMNRVVEIHDDAWALRRRIKNARTPVALRNDGKAKATR